MGYVLQKSKIPLCFCILINLMLLAGFPMGVSAQPDAMTARGLSLGGAVGALPLQPDAIYTNPAELTGNFLARASGTLTRSHFTWSPDTLMVSGGEFKSTTYALQYQQSYFGAAVNKGSHETVFTDPGESVNGTDLSEADFLSVRMAVADMISYKSLLGVTGVYQKYEFKQANNERQEYAYFSANTGMSYISNDGRYRLGLYVLNAYGQKKKTPRLDRYGQAILLEHEPRDFHASLSIISSSGSVLIVDVGYLLTQKIDTSVPGMDELALPRWKSQPDYRLGFELMTSGNSSFRFGVQRSQSLKCIDLAHADLLYDQETVYYAGGKLRLNRFLLDLGVKYQNRDDNFYDEFLDTKGRIITFATTIHIDLGQAAAPKPVVP